MPQPGSAPGLVAGPGIDQLNTALRAELGAAETCDRARDFASAALDGVLLANRDCHRTRAHAISALVQTRGGEPSIGWGIWPEIAAWCGASRRPSPEDLRALLIAGEERHRQLCLRVLARIDAGAAAALRPRLLRAQEAVLERLRLPAPQPEPTAAEPEIELVRRGW